jgi:hypothetical protein
MRSRRMWIGGLMMAVTVACQPAMAQSQCCLSGLLNGCGSCFRKAPPAYAVAPVAAPVVAPVPVPVSAAPPAPVMVPMQQVSYVPETTYQTKYECVPVTCYKPFCEIDPCTGASLQAYEHVTQYVQKPVSVPVTQYRAVYSTKYVQVQPGAVPAYGAVAAPATQSPATAVSPFAPAQTTPQAWGSAGADVPQQLVPGQPAMQPPATYQQQIIPQSGAFPAPAPAAAAQPQPTLPPSLSPTPSLRPIPELPRTPAASSGQAAAGSPNTVYTDRWPAPSATGSTNRTPADGGSNADPRGQSDGGPAGSPLPSDARMPVLPGSGPNPSTRAFPKLLEPTSHTTSWQPSASRQSTGNGSGWQPAVVPPTANPYAGGYRASYPTAALPIRSQQ